MDSISTVAILLLFLTISLVLILLCVYCVRKRDKLAGSDSLTNGKVDLESPSGHNGGKQPDLTFMYALDDKSQSLTPTDKQLYGRQYVSDYGTVTGKIPEYNSRIENKLPNLTAPESSDMIPSSENGVITIPILPLPASRQSKTDHPVDVSIQLPQHEDTKTKHVAFASNVPDESCARVANNDQVEEIGIVLPKAKETDYSKDVKQGQKAKPIHSSTGALNTTMTDTDNSAPPNTDRHSSEEGVITIPILPLGKKQPPRYDSPGDQKNTSSSPQHLEKNVKRVAFASDQPESRPETTRSLNVNKGTEDASQHLSQTGYNKVGEPIHHEDPVKGIPLAAERQEIHSTSPKNPHVFTDTGSDLPSPEQTVDDRAQIHAAKWTDPSVKPVKADQPNIDDKTPSPPVAVASVRPSGTMHRLGVEAPPTNRARTPSPNRRRYDRRDTLAAPGRSSEGRRSPSPSFLPPPPPSPPVDYTNQELQLSLLHLESLSELVVTVKQGKNFDPAAAYKVRVRVARDGGGGGAGGSVVDQQRDTKQMPAEGFNPRWAEHLVFGGMRDSELDVALVTVSVLKHAGADAEGGASWDADEGAGWEECGEIQFGTASPHESGRKQWLRVLAKEGIVDSWHYLVAPGL